MTSSFVMRKLKNKTVSNIACEYIITSDNEFFTRIEKKKLEDFLKLHINLYVNIKI